GCRARAPLRGGARDAPSTKIVARATIRVHNRGVTTWVAPIHQRVLRVRRALRISETTWLFLLAALAGALAGLGSIAFHELIALFQWFAFGTAKPAGPLDVIVQPGYPRWRIVLAPALGGLA